MRRPRACRRAERGRGRAAVEPGVGRALAAQDRGWLGDAVDLDRAAVAGLAVDRRVAAPRHQVGMVEVAHAETIVRAALARQLR